MFPCRYYSTSYIKQHLYTEEKYPNAEYLARKGFYIPSGLGMTKEQMEIVADRTVEILKNI